MPHDRHGVRLCPHQGALANLLTSSGHLIDTDRLRALLAQDEGRTLEFKRVYNFNYGPPEVLRREKDEAAKDLIALANSAGLSANDTAYLILGADDRRGGDGKRRCYDVRTHGYTAEHFLALVNGACYPPLADLVYIELELDGNCYGIIAIPPSQLVHVLKRNLTTKGGHWQSTVAPVRHGNAVEPATSKEVALLERRKTAWLSSPPARSLSTGERDFHRVEIAGAFLCSSCGFSNKPGVTFCGGCGATLGASATTPGRRSSSLEAYTPKHLAERILTSKSALEGERKQVTVLFADLKGSMELVAGRDPEEAWRLLDSIVGHMMEAVHHYEGTVNHVMGDGIMALFGAPVAHEDHAVRACYAALRMQESVKQHAESLFDTHGATVRIRVGLNSGEVVVRAIGSDLRMDYTAVGETTHLANRMEQSADPGTILLAPATFQLAEEYVEVRRRGPAEVKGLKHRVELYELLGASPMRFRLHASAARGLTRFVGRDTELGQLHRALERAEAGRGEVVAIVGEPGVGKSRLYWEFIQRARSRTCLILESACVSYGTATPYSPVIELLKSYFEIEARDDTGQMRAKVTDKLVSLDHHLQPALAPVLSLLDVRAEDAAWEQLDPAQRRQKTLESVKRLLIRQSQMQPLLLIVENLHWVDSESQTFLDTLVESLPTARALLLVSYRPDYQHGWGSKTYYTQLRLDPLSPKTAEELLDSLLGADPGLQPIKGLLVERTQGNPFFLEESTRSLVETKALVGERSAYRLAKEVRTIHVPATVQAMLAARIDRLMAEDKRLLQAASVIGKDVPFVLLHAISGVSEDDLRQGLTRLQAAEFLYETQLFPDLEYTFKHALTHEVTYGGLLHERARGLHANVVAAIESLHADRLNEHLERLADHAVRGEVWDKAVAYLRQAGAKAFDRSPSPKVVDTFEKALQILEQLPPDRSRIEQIVDVCFDLRNVLVPIGEVVRGHNYLLRAEPLITDLKDPRRLARVSTYLGAHRWLTGRPRDACDIMRNVPTIADELQDFHLQVVGNLYLGASLFAAGSYRDAEGCLLRVVGRLDDGRFDDRFGEVGFPAVLARSWLAFSLGEEGEFAKARVHGDESVRLAETLGHPFTLEHALWGAGYLYSAIGEFDHAISVLSRAIGISEEHKLTGILPTFRWSLGHAYTLAGRFEEGLALVERSLESRMGPHRSLALVHLGEALAGRHRLDEASIKTQEGERLARDGGQRGYEAWAVFVRAEIASHPSSLSRSTAEEVYGRAIESAANLGMRPLVTRCHLGLGKFYGQLGEREHAHGQLMTAITMFREMDMRFWLEKAEAEMRELESASGNN
jgi:class 3 adenylate cyclase